MRMGHKWVWAGLFLLLLLAFLFIWKNATPLVPAQSERQEALQSGKESVAGLTNLLRRNVRAPELLQVCYAEWQKSGKNISEQGRRIMEEILAGQKKKPARQQDLPAAYNALSRALKQRR